MSVNEQLSSRSQEPRSNMGERTGVTRVAGTGEHKYQMTKDRYVGGVDPVSKLRHGQGTYTYTNPFFQYQGEYD